MQPQQPQPNYDFIMNPGSAPKKTPLGGDSSLAMRLLVAVIGVFILLIVGVVLLKLITGGGGGSFDKAAMLNVAQDQTELIRVSTLGAQSSTVQANKNFSITTQLGLTSEQKTLLGYLSQHGLKINDKQLLLKQNAQTDSQLSTATSSSTFDEVYRGIMQKQLQSYESDLSAAYKGSSASAKTVLTKQYNAAQLLTTQLNNGV